MQSTSRSRLPNMPRIFIYIAFCRKIFPFAKHDPPTRLQVCISASSFIDLFCFATLIYRAMLPLPNPCILYTCVTIAVTFWRRAWGLINPVYLDSMRRARQSLLTNFATDRGFIFAVNFHRFARLSPPRLEKFLETDLLDVGVQIAPPVTRTIFKGNLY